MTAFEEFGVLPEIAKAVDEMEWMLPTDVQAEAIPLILGGGDVLMAAETGSGKTAAFCIPILQIVWESMKERESGSTGSVSKPWTMSWTDRGSALAVAPCGVKVQSREFKEWHGVRCTTGVQGKGKWGFEVVVNDEGLVRVGWSLSQAALDLGTDRFGFGFGGTGKKSNCKQFDNYGEAFGKGDVISCCLDLDSGNIMFSKNGQDLGVAFSIPQQLRNQAFYPAVVLKNAETTFNFGETDFKYALPGGFQSVSKAPSERVVKNPNSGGSGGNDNSSPATCAPKAIIIEPSRELAEQTCTQLSKLGKHLSAPAVRDLLIIGGVNVQQQIQQLKAGVDLVVGTPGRLEDLIQNGNLNLSHCQFFVLDEADGLLKANYGPLIERLHRQMPKTTGNGRRLQMIVCSATLHAFEVKKMAEKLMHFPTWVDLKGEDAVPETVHHVVVSVDPQKDRSWNNLRHVPTDGVHHPSEGGLPEQMSQAVKLLKPEYCLRAIEEHNMDRALIFCRTKIDCDNLEKFLQDKDRRKYSCVCLHGDRKPPERKNNLERFKRQEVRFLICTDVAARGIDVSGLPFVINVTLPDDKSNYVHRIGRVGRAERMGLALSLVSSVPEKVWYHGEWCPSRGRHCNNTRLTDQGGCCIWYDEMRCLADIEEHLNCTIQQIETDMKVPSNEFDGRVVYGQKKASGPGTDYKNHTEQMAPIVKELARLESAAQLTFLNRHLIARS